MHFIIDNIQNVNYIINEKINKLSSTVADNITNSIQAKPPSTFICDKCEFESHPERGLKMHSRRHIHKKKVNVELETASRL